MKRKVNWEQRETRFFCFRHQEKVFFFSNLVSFQLIWIWSYFITWFDREREPAKERKLLLRRVKKTNLKSILFTYDLVTQYYLGDSTCTRIIRIIVNSESYHLLNKTNWERNKSQIFSLRLESLNIKIFMGQVLPLMMYSLAKTLCLSPFDPAFSDDLSFGLIH